METFIVGQKPIRTSMNKAFSVAIFEYHRFVEFRLSLLVATRCGLVGEFDTEVESISHYLHECAASSTEFLVVLEMRWNQN